VRSRKSDVGKVSIKYADDNGLNDEVSWKLNTNDEILFILDGVTDYIDPFIGSCACETPTSIHAKAKSSFQYFKVWIVYRAILLYFKVSMFIFEFIMYQ
jgi:hypothetical protein